MEARHIIAGFSEIKSALRTKTQMTKSMQQIELWFSCDDDVLYVHDYEDNLKSLALAIYFLENKCWKSFFRNRSCGETLVVYYCEKYPSHLLAEEFNELYRLYGFIPFGKG